MKNRPIAIFVLLIILSAITSVNALQKLDFEPPRGLYLESFPLTITAPVENAAIRYTLDGTDPMTSSTAKSAASPLTITVNPDDFTGRDHAPGVCVRAIAVVADTAASNLNTHTYIFPEKVGTLSRDEQRPGTKWPAQGRSVNGQRMDYGMDNSVYNSPRYRDKMLAAMTDIPSMSMVLDLDDLFDPSTGIYVNAAEHGEEWERPCSLELINPDGSDGFHINCGVRIRGGYSRVPHNPKHAFRFFFRGEYGESKLRHPLFDDEGVDEFDKIDLRTSQNYSWAYGAGSKDGGPERNTMLRDVFSRDLQRDMGQPYTRSRYYHLFINGTYWGLFQTQERSEASFAEAYFGGNREDYDAIKVDAGLGRPYVMEATDGTLDAWNTLWTIVRNGVSDKATFNRIQGLNPDGTRNPEYIKYLDVNNLIDYMIDAYFVGDFDAPISAFLGNDRPNNFWATFNRVNPDGFKFYRHDSEHTLFNVNEDRIGPYPAGEQQQHFNPQWLHQELTANAEYRLLFSDRVFRYFAGSGVLSPQANINRLMSRKNTIDNAIIAESARWGDALRDSPFTRDNEWMNEVDFLVNEYFPQRSDIILDQFTDAGWYPNFAPPEFNADDQQVDAGFQLTMTAPSGTIYYTTDGSPVYGQISGSGIQVTTLAPWSAEKRVFVPTNDIGNAWRTNIDFDDSDWDLVSGAPGGIGYEKSNGYESYISHDVAKYMHQDDTATPNTSCYVRIPFNLTQDNLNDLIFLETELRYDDGFVLYLNGLKVAEILAPTPLEWNSPATDNHEADDVETFDLSDHISKLKVGKNVLAIHGLNYSLTSSDFLVHAQILAGYENETTGGIISPTAKAYTGPITIDKSTRVKARVLRGSQWSALNQILLSVDEDMSGLRPTEIHYNPIPDGEGETKIDGDLFEFFEIKNISGAPINLTGAQFTKGISYEFPAGASIHPGGFYVVCSSADHFRSRYNFEAHGQYSGNLSNGGERVVLLSAVGDTLINVRYNDKLPWPPEADSTGQSLVAYATQPQGDHSLPEYWKLSAAVHGSPNADDLASPVADEPSSLPQAYRLLPNYPNPFNPKTTVRFETPRDGHVSLILYNAIGQKVDVLKDEHIQAGTHELHWDGAHVAGGVYFVRMQAMDYHRTIKILYLK